MRTGNIVLLCLLVAVVAGAGGAWFGGRRHDATPAAPATAAPAAREVLYWYDPMVPKQRFDKPGKSPFMDMMLVPRYADEVAGAGALRIDPGLVQALGVRTAPARSGVLAPRLRVAGVVAFDEREVALVQARTEGIVERLHVRAPWAAVRRGEPLLTLLAPAWTAAQEEYLALRGASHAGIEPLRAAARQRLLLLGMDEAAIRALERSGRAQARIALSAPRDGVLAELLVREGASVATGAALARINGLDSVWIEAAIPERDAAGVAAGTPATATLAALPGQRFEGRVEALLPDVDPATRTLTARIALANPGHALLPGMFPDVELAPVVAAAERVLVPSEAVIDTGVRQVVIVGAGKGRFRAQQVRIGREADGQAEILEGIAEGEPVVLSGQFLIDSEASLVGALARLGAADDDGAAP